MTDAHGPNGAYSEVFEEAEDAQQTQTIHRIRANSTIMQLKKILGECAFRLRSEQLGLDGRE
jgi:pyruvate carboxylase